MAPQGAHTGPARVGLIFLLVLGVLLTACGKDEGGPEAALSTTTTQADATTDTAPPPSIPNPVLLLLTAADIGDGWVEQDEEMPHPEAVQAMGLLCPQGQSIADELGAGYQPQVWAVFAPEGLTSSESFVSEILMQEELDQNLDDFTALASAVDNCIGTDPWEIPGAGLVTMERLDTPAAAGGTYGFRLTLSPETGSPPTAEMRQIGIRLGRFTVQVTAAVMHGSPEPPTIEDADLLRLAQVAVDKVTGVEG